MYADATAGQVGSPVPQDTLLSLLTEVDSVSSNISRSIAQVADALSGSTPEKAANQPIPPSSAIERLRSILYMLQSAHGDSSRAKRALGISDLSDPKSTRNPY